MSGLGSGWAKNAPGTWGTLASLPVFYGIYAASGENPAIMAVAIVLVTALGCMLCARILPPLKVQDPGWIVIDEWAGQWLCLTLCLMIYHNIQPAWHEYWVWLMAFLLFRMFDIFKPYPINACEHIGPAWWSIMADDLMAGAMGAGVFFVVLVVI
ncbi:MAG: phosphatidylglycerophosphatase A [Mariprofundaceae bacterium]|nr:phosphatidylglycerophosphatase A [Mariprofundaceae bacterium]